MMTYFRNFIHVLYKNHQKIIIIFSVFILMFLGGVRYNPLNSLIISFISTVWLIGCYALFARILKFRFQKKYFHFFQPFLYFLLILTLIFVFTKLELWIYKDYLHYKPTLKVYWVFPTMKNILFITGTFITALLVYTNNQQKKTEKLAAENQNMELKLLRAQINPHFLFNSLNNIYSLIYSKNEKAGDAVLYLAELLRYVVDDANSETVPLSKEVKYIDHFIDLWKIRIGETIHLQFNKSIDDSEVKLPPMILQPIIENCFIYSDIESNKEAYITLDLHVENKVLILKTENSTSEKKHSIEKKISGIGINNVKHRLKLFYGAQNFELKIDNKENYYKLYLKINLT